MDIWNKEHQAQNVKSTWIKYSQKLAHDSPMATFTNTVFQTFLIFLLICLIGFENIEDALKKDNIFFKETFTASWNRSGSPIFMYS